MDKLLSNIFVAMANYGTVSCNIEIIIIIFIRKLLTHLNYMMDIYMQGLFNSLRYMIIYKYI